MSTPEFDALPAVELRQAFEWTCDACGKDFFTRTITIARAELEDLARRKPEFRAWLDLVPPGVADQFVRAPEGVQCPSCGARYRVVGPAIAEEDPE